MCGIFGIIQNKKRKFDKRAFISLGVANDRRGKDSCGIFIDKWSEYGVDKEKLFLDFFKNSSLLSNITDAKVILGHCRKASVGKISKETAQPVVIYEGKLPVYVLIHNGTIYNYENLAKKYIPDIDIKNMTDSQVMAHIFYYSGYDVLSEYVGGGMFVMYDLRTDDIFMFKGCSLSTSTAKEPSEERPCYFVKTNESIVFSSVWEELSALYYDNVVYTLPSNTLFRIHNCKITKAIGYDRSKATQYKPVVATTAHYYNYNNCSYIGFNKKLLCYTDSENKLAQGEYFISNYGLLSQIENNWFKPYYFYNGMLLYNETCYDFLLELARENKENSVRFQTALQLLTVCPIVKSDKYGRKMYKINLEDFKVKPCSEIKLPFCAQKAIQLGDDIEFKHCSEYNSELFLSDDDFLKIVDYVLCI